MWKCAKSQIKHTYGQELLLLDNVLFDALERVEPFLVVLADLFLIAVPFDTNDNKIKSKRKTH